MHAIAHLFQNRCEIVLQSISTQGLLLFQKLNILNFEKLKLEFEIGIFMWKVPNDKEPQTLEDHSSIREKNFGHNNVKFHFPLANTNLFKWDNVYQGPKFWNYSYPPRHWNTGLVSSWASLTSWGNPYSNSVTIKTPYGVDVLHQPASPFFSYRVG